jgi:hypothetical protein
MCLTVLAKAKIWPGPSFTQFILIFSGATLDEIKTSNERANNRLVLPVGQLASSSQNPVKYF